MRIYSKADGSFTFASTYPGRYGGNGLLRPAHIHVKITPVDQFNRPLSSKPFTTQMYFDKGMLVMPLKTSDIFQLTVEPLQMYSIIRMICASSATLENTHKKYL